MIIPTGFAQCNLFFTGFAMPRGGQVTIGVEVNPGDGTALALAEGVGQAWVENILPLQSLNITLNKVLCKKGPNETGASAEAPFGLPGGVAESSLEPQCALLVAKQTALGGRSQRGRMFVPGISDLQYGSDGQFTADNIATFNAAFQQFLDDLEALEIPAVLLHNAEGLDPTPITSMPIQLTVSTQRRRIRKAGGRRRRVIP